MMMMMMNILRKHFAFALTASLAIGAAACGDSNKHANSPHAYGDLASPLSAAFKEEAIGDPVKAVDLYFRALADAATSPENPASVSVAAAALDALVMHDFTAFSDSTTTSALYDRIDPAVLKKNGGTIEIRLAKVAGEAEGPFVPSLIARARLELAERSGDAAAAADLRQRAGCSREATLLGPVAWMPVSGIREASIFDKVNTALPSQVPGPGPFTPSLRPLKVASFGCRIPLDAETAATGVREVAVDVEVPKSGHIGLGLHSSAAAVLRAGGQLVIDRPHELGARKVARYSRVDAAPGTLRVVVRVGVDQDFSSIEIGAWDENGKPLAQHAPLAGQKAASVVKRVTPIYAPEPKTDSERVAYALGALAKGEVRHAENLLAPQLARTDAPPEMLLVYARAVRLVRDLPAVKQQERARNAYDRALELWPASWEATLEHAVLAGARRGRAEANIETINDLDAMRAKSKSSQIPLFDAFEAQVAGREHLDDRARAAFDRIKAPLANTMMLIETDRTVFERTGRDLVTFDCNPANGNRTSLACHNALSSAGDREAAEKEIERLRVLEGTSQLYLSLSARNALETGDLARAQKFIDAMNPGDRALSSIYATKGKAAVPELLHQAVVARDSPAALPSILRDTGEDPIAQYEGIAEKVVNDNSLGPILANAATAILAHTEKYDIDSSGLIHYTLFDVRRMMGTADVESNAQAGAPTLFGKDTVRVLRRRILKKDGRIMLPDRTPHASQSHADLSQLEAGDAVEAIYEGWGVPNETGNLGIDTPDLLSERTAVHEATIELRLPAGLRGSMWSHPMLGKAEETTATQGGQNKRVLVWHMKERPVRRLESGVPKMDRSVGISFSTATWDDVARGLRETILSLDADSPEVTTWAREAAGGRPVSRELVDKVVAASDAAVKEANGIVLADIDLGHGGGHGMSARNILATREGSRTWLIVRALRELGVPTDIAVAENDPFSDSASFPPHFGRFMHPLAIAHVPGANGAAASDVWIDADVPGPPLPAGRISPELRGRNALYPDGRIAPLPNLAGDAERDEIDIRLVVDDAGNAKGTITVLLRGTSAQDLAEALVHLVGVERDRALRGIALGWVPFATVDKVELSSSEGSWQVAMRADLTAPGYAQQEGTKPETRAWILPGMDPIHYVFPRPFVTTLSSTYASQAARESALAINHATLYHVRRRVELPAKASIARLPGPFEGKGPLMAASRKISVAGTSIEEDFTLDVTTGTIPRDRYDAFVTESHRTDDAFRASTRVKPPLP